MDAKIKKAKDQVLEIDKLLETADPNDEGYSTVCEKAAGGLGSLATWLREAAIREPVGETDIVDKLVQILKNTTAQLEAKSTKVQFDLLNQAGRVASNLAVDCDINRDRLTKAQYPERLLELFRVGRTQLPVTTLHPLVASLLNLVVDRHAAVVASLSKREDLMTVVQLASTQYTPPEWSEDPLPATISGWLWNIADNIVDPKSPPTYSLSTSEINLFVAPLNINSTKSPDDDDIDVEDAFTNDLKIITHSSNILDRFSVASKLDQIDSEQLERIADFIEKSKHPEWIESAEPEVAEDIEKTLGKAKGNLAQAFVSVLADRTDAGLPKEILERLNSWLKIADRPDLLAVALLAYGNYAREDTRSIELVSGPTSLLPTILPLLDPTTPVQTQHAVIGLLRNLAIPAANRKPLGKADVIPKLMSMKPWEDTRDIVGSIQGGSIAIVKQLVRDSDNALQFLSLQEGVDALVALIKRTNDPPIALEGTRVWINCMRALASAKALNGWDKLNNPGIIDSVVRLLTSGQRYPLLVNESLLGMVYLAAFGGYRKEVAERLMASESVEVEGQKTPSRGVDVLAEIIAPPLGQTYAPETQANAVTLVTQLKSAEVDDVLKVAVALARDEQRAVAQGWK